MKKIFAVLAAAAVLAGCSGNRGELLKVYNWSDYIDEEVISEFEQWYEEQTGEKVEVIYQTFDINETMLSKIEKGHEDFDIVCPSDYIIERMLANDLLLPVSRDFGETPNYIDDNLSPFIKDYFSHLSGNGRNANDYSVGYMWGTTGILYNAAYVTDEEASSWDILRNPKFADKIFVKDSARDVYSQIIAFLNYGKSVSMDSLMFYTGDANILAVENYMNQVKPLVAGWEADFGKDQMIRQRGYVNLSWSGDAVWAIDEASEIGVDLRFALPKEGFSVWFDGWVIPKYAKNEKAARYWINFMSRPDIVARNMDATGYVSVSSAPEVLENFIDESYEPVDLSYFFGEGFEEVRTNPVLYPDRKDIEHSFMEHDWGEHTDKLIQMWSRVKGSNVDGATVIVVTAFMVVLVALIFTRFFSGRKKSKSRKRR